MGSQNMIENNFSKFAKNYRSNMQKNLVSFKRNEQESEVKSNFYIIDSHSLDFQDKSNDLIISHNVTWVLRDREALYSRCKRLLKYG